MRRAPGMMMVLTALALGACQGPAGGGGSTGAGGGAPAGKPTVRVVGARGGTGEVPAFAQPQDFGKFDPHADFVDPCAGNLGEVVEAMLVYYGVHRKLPATLGELPGKTFAGKDLKLTCPATGARYAYYPAGYSAPMELMPNGMRLLMYDTEASHTVVKHVKVGRDEYDLKQQVRYGIVMRPPEAGQPIEMYVVPVDQALFDIYMKSGERVRVREAGQ